uniref:Uncharacterized protein n=1 Tax=Anguilla anguilla TaxID=7936 RepID=A0A0E9TRH0_ANGAN
MGNLHFFLQCCAIWNSLRVAVP